MVEVPIKQEPKTAPLQDQQLRLSPDLSDRSLSPTENAAGNLPQWKRNTNKPRAQIVQINEAAAEDGLIFFSDVRKILQIFSDEIPQSKTRINEIGAILERRKDCNIRIGFLGATGTGKSSLINALLMEEILPRSFESSSTAVPVEVTYNISTDPEKRFRAEIEGISGNEFRRELEELYQDHQILNAGSGEEDDEKDIEFHKRITDTFAKLKAIFPDLKELDDLEKVSAEQLFNRPCVHHLVDKTRAKSAPDASSFAEKIRGFIDANDPDSKEAMGCRWPLVKVVRIYHKAEILRRGIVLVDLPGCHDTSAARVAATEKYKKSLTMSCVLAPAIRAASDLTAHELLSSVSRTAMQLDGLYSSQTLFFVITKTDDLLDPTAYIKDYPNLRKQLAEDLNLESKNQFRINSLQVEITKKTKVFEGLRQKIDKVQNTVHRGTARIEKIIAGFAKAGTKRKRSIDEIEESDLSTATIRDRNSVVKFRETKKDLMDQTKVSQELGCELFLLQNKAMTLTKNLKDTRSRIKKSCIVNRSLIQANAARAEYEQGRKMMGQQRSEKPLQVFSVSAAAFSDISRGESDDAIDRGFRTKMDTGIPGLRDAILATTWDSRENNDRAFNIEVENFLKKLKIWSSDTFGDYKMLGDQRAIVESNIESAFSSLHQEFSMLQIETGQSIESLIQKGIIDKLPLIANKAAAIAKKLVLRWALVPWSTHRATNKRNGTWKASNGIEYDWNEELTQVFLRLIIKTWAETFHNHLHELRATHDKQVTAVVAKFVELVMAAADNVSPLVTDALQIIKESISNIQILLKNQGKYIFDSINGAAKDAHRLIKPEVEKTWQQTYETCGSATGRGHFKVNQLIHQRHVNSAGGLLMYQKAGSSIEKELRSAVTQIRDKFEAGFESVATQIKEDINVMLDSHSTAGTHATSRRVPCGQKIRLGKLLTPAFEALEASWGMNSEPQLAEIEVAVMKSAEEDSEEEEESDEIDLAESRELGESDLEESEETDDPDLEEIEEIDETDVEESEEIHDPDLDEIEENNSIDSEADSCQ